MYFVTASCTSEWLGKDCPANGLSRRSKSRRWPLSWTEAATRSSRAVLYQSSAAKRRENSAQLVLTLSGLPVNSSR